MTRGPASPLARAKRRTFTAAYKQQIVAEYNAAPQGHKGAILRRERLYDSHVQEWRAAVAAGTLDTAAKQGHPRGSSRSPEQKRIADLERDNTRLQVEIIRRDETIKDREAALEVLEKGVAFLEALSSRNAQ